MGVAGLMAVWALILAFVGGVKLIGPNDGKGPWLVFASGLMAVASLGAWVAVIGRSGGVAVVLRIVQVAATVAAFGTLTWGLVRPSRSRTASVVAVAAVSLVVAWSASRLAKLHRENARSLKAGEERRRADRL